jgi:osmoprotectant transport system substrate-binding protein
MKRIRLAIMLTVWTGALAACGSSSSSTATTGGGATGGTANCPAPASGASTSLTGASLKIGSKSFAEQQIAAEIAKQALTKAGATVEYSTQEADTQIGTDLQGGKINLLWQYTGTELGTYLQQDTVPSDLHAAFTKAQMLDDAKALCWVGETPMNDTNGIAIRQADSGKYGSTLSDFTTYLQSHSDVKVCIMSEFKTRPDGVPGLQSKYGSVWGSYNYTEIAKTAEPNLKKGDCDAGEVFTTDSGIAANNLVVLKDNKGLFPADNLGLIVRSDVLKQYPQIAAIIDPIAAKMTTDAFLSLNKMVEIDSMKPADVAATWLQQNGF